MSRRHEQLLFRYSSALERGEFDTVADVLREAERDPALEQAILEMNAAYAAERLDSTNHVNHTNPREVPMTVALYQRRASSPIHWQSVPLVAALGVIAVLTFLLAAQIRSNAVFNTGTGDNNAPALGQSAICEARLREAADARSRAGDNSVVIGTIPEGAGVKVLDQELTGASGTLWFFVVSEGASVVQGWIPAATLAESDCPQASVVQAATASATLSPDFSIALTATQMITDATATAPGVQALPTFTLTPAQSFPVITSTPLPVTGFAVPTFTLVPADSGWVIGDGTSQYTFPTACEAVMRATTDVLSTASWDGQVLNSYPRGTLVRVSAYAVTTDEQGEQEAWYFGAIEQGTGWVLASLLDASKCPAVPPTFTIAPVEPDIIVPANVQPIPSEPQAFTVVSPTVPPADGQPLTFTPVPFTIQQATIPPMVIPADGTYSGFSGCYLFTDQNVRVYREASTDADILDVLPERSALQITALTQQGESKWYWVTYTTLLGEPGSGYVTADSITLPNEGCRTPEFTVSAAPVDTPLLLQPTVIGGTVAVQATPQYYLYVAQPGDTLVSILARFGLDLSAMPEVMRANNLTEDSVIAPGITLYVPTSQQLLSLACKIDAAEALDVRVRPEMDAPVISTLPVGATFELIDRSQQRDGVWYAIAATVEGVTMRSAWVSPGAITVPSDCQQSVPGTVITLVPASPSATPIPVPTATVMP